MKPTNFYNLDVIISVGYRVKSRQGTMFRIWATQRLRDYIIRGYALNEEGQVAARQICMAWICSLVCRLFLGVCASWWKAFPRLTGTLRV